MAVIIYQKRCNVAVIVPSYLNFTWFIPVNNVRNVVDMERIQNLLVIFHIDSVKISCFGVVFKNNPKQVIRRDTIKKRDITHEKSFFQCKYQNRKVFDLR